jgi:hypothetical protein
MKINAMMYASGGKKDCGITVKQKIESLDRTSKTTM